MINISHIANIISQELAVFTFENWMVAAIFTWLTYLFIKRAKAFSYRLFWFLTGIFLLHNVFLTNSILLSSDFYIALTMILTHINVPISFILLKIKQYRNKEYKLKLKYENNCMDRMDQFVVDLENKHKKNRLDIENNSKRKSELKFLEDLSAKLGSF
jgi:hypothetical protein